MGANLYKLSANSTYGKKFTGESGEVIFSADGSRVPTFQVHGIDINGVFTTFGRITYTTGNSSNDITDVSVHKYQINLTRDVYLQLHTLSMLVDIDENRIWQVRSSKIIFD